MPLYDSQQLSIEETAAPTATLDEILNAGLATFIEEVLVLQSSADWTGQVYAHWSAEMIGPEAYDEALRTEVMVPVSTGGAPVRFCQIWPADPFETGEDFDGRPLYRFNVVIMYGVGDATRATAQTAFNDLIGDTAPAAPGIIHALRRHGTVVIATDHELEIGYEPGSLGLKFMEVEHENDRYWHEATFVAFIG